MGLLLLCNVDKRAKVQVSSGWCGWRMGVGLAGFLERTVTYKGRN